MMVSQENTTTGRHSIEERNNKTKCIEKVIIEKVEKVLLL